MLVGCAVAEEGLESVAENGLCAALYDAFLVFNGHLYEGDASFAVDAKNEDDGFGEA